MAKKKEESKAGGKSPDEARDKLIRLVVLDSHALIHRAYHALPDFSSSKGEPTGALYGLITMLIKIAADLKPDYLVAARDLPGATNRHELFEAYKATRVKAEDELVAQLSRAPKIFEAFGIPVYSAVGYEADDAIGTIVKKLKPRKDINIVIVTGDLDTLQLVSDRVEVYTMRKGITDTVTYDAKAVKERYGLAPSQLADFKGLRGDPSDNIPGVKGIGEKTASELLKKYCSLEKLYQSLKKAKLSPSVREKLEKEKEEAFFSKALATINLKVPVAFSLGDASWDGPQGKAAVEKLFYEFGFTSLLRRLGYLEEQAQEAGDKEQSGLFGETISTLAAPQPVLRKDDFSGRKEIGFIKTDAGVILVTRDAHYQLTEDLVKAKEMQNTLEAERARVFFDEKAVLKSFGSQVIQPQDFDILIAAYLLRPGEREYSVERAAREAGIPANDPRRIFDIAEALKKILETKKLLHVFTDIEMPLVPILAEVEGRGMKLDLKFLSRLSSETQLSFRALESDIYKLAGFEFNINSPKQVSDALFTKLGLADKGIRKTEGGGLSTDAGELAKLKDAHPIISKILEHRELAKLMGTYIDALPKLTEPDGTLHTTLNQIGRA